MAGLVVLDAGVLIALLDAHDSHHSWALDFFYETVSEELAMSTLTFAEVMVHPQKEGKASEFQRSIAGLNLRFCGIGLEDAKWLSALRQRTGLKMPDAVVLNLAMSQNAALATTDGMLATQGGKEGIRVLSL